MKTILAYFLTSLAAVAQTTGDYQLAKWNGTKWIPVAVTPGANGTAAVWSNGLLSSVDLAGMYSPLGHSHTFASLTSKPTTLAGYGIADGITADLAASTYATQSALSTGLSGKSDATHTHTFASLTSKPSTLSGYGITDSITATSAASTYQPIIGDGTLPLSKLAADPLARANHTGTQSVSTITGLGGLATLSAAPAGTLTGSTLASGVTASSLLSAAGGSFGTLAYQSGTFSGSSSGTNTGDNAVNSLYSGLVSNASHTGDATGSTALTVVRINGQSLAALGTGILKNTTGTGIPSIAIAGTDYLSPTGNGSGVTNLDGANIATGNIAVARIVTALTTPGPIGGTAPSTVAMTNGAFTGEFKSTTAITTPSAFVATSADFFAHTTRGGVIRGLGSTNDVSFENRNGNIAIGITANTSDVVFGGKISVPSTLAVTGASTLGALTITPPATATPASNGQLTFEATSNTSLRINYKGSDGTVRHADLTLAP